MSARSIHLFDLPTVARYRPRALPLDAARLLTRGDPLGPTGLLAYLNPARYIYTALDEQDGAILLGGVIRYAGQDFARLTFLAPADALTDAALGLLDHLAVRAGEWQATHVLAEVEETSAVFSLLRRAGYAVYAWQTNWLLPAGLSEDAEGFGWRAARDEDLPRLQSLYQQIVPGLLQPVEPYPRRAQGLVCCQGEDIRAHVRLTGGARGVLADPLFHPGIADVGRLLGALPAAVPARAGRPVYLRMRSYQAWLEPALADLGAESGPRQALMVRALGVTGRVERPAGARPERAVVKPAAPIAPAKSRLES